MDDRVGFEGKNRQSMGNLRFLSGKIRMAAHVRKDQVHEKPSSEFVDSERTGYWTAYYGALELESAFEHNVVFAGQPSESFGFHKNCLAL